MKKYEYLMLTWSVDDRESTLEKMERSMNEVGDDGWELVSVVPLNNGTDSCMYYFKRLKTAGKTV